MGLNLGICGVGSLASLFAAKIAALDSPLPFRTIMLGNWQNQIQQINRSGLKLYSQLDVVETIQVSAMTWKDCPQLDIAIVLNKSYQTEATARQLAGRLSKSALVLTLQNGLGNADILQRLTGCRTLSGITSEAAYRPELAGVVHAGKGKTTIEASAHPLMAMLLNILLRAGFEIETTSRIKNDIWNKLLLNIAINPITAIFDIKNGQLPQDPLLFRLAYEAAEEAATVASANGVVIGNIESSVRDICSKTAKNHSSMLQDIASARQTEIDAICGAVCRQGKAVGIETPLNTMLYNNVTALESNSVERKTIQEELRAFAEERFYETV